MFYDTITQDIILPDYLKFDPSKNNRYNRTQKIKTQKIEFLSDITAGEHDAHCLHLQILYYIPLYGIPI